MFAAYGISCKYIKVYYKRCKSTKFFKKGYGIKKSYRVALPNRQALSEKDIRCTNGLYLTTYRDRDLTEKEADIIRQLATSEPVVKNLWLLWELYMKSNRTGIDNANMTDWKTFLEDNRGFIESFDFLKDLAIENPGESSVLKISFEQKVLNNKATDFLPFFGTDIGFCSMLKPQLSFNKELDHLPYMIKMFGHYSHNWNISKGAKVGKANGLSMWLDAETFDYTYHVNAGEGFKLAIMHHLDQPIMSIRELVSCLVYLSPFQNCRLLSNRLNVVALKMVIKPIAKAHKVKICCDKTIFCFGAKFNANLL